MPTNGFKRDAIALTVLAHPSLGFSVSAASNVTGHSRQRWHHRLRRCVDRGWVVRTEEPGTTHPGAPLWKLTPGGSAVVEDYRAKIREVEKARGRLPWMELLGGQWFSGR